MSKAFAMKLCGATLEASECERGGPETFNPPFGNKLTDTSHPLTVLLTPPKRFAAIRG